MYSLFKIYEKRERPLIFNLLKITLNLELVYQKNFVLELFKVDKIKYFLCQSHLKSFFDLVDSKYFTDLTMYTVCHLIRFK